MRNDPTKTTRLSDPLEARVMAISSSQFSREDEAIAPRSKHKGHVKAGEPRERGRGEPELGRECGPLVVPFTYYAGGPSPSSSHKHVYLWKAQGARLLAQDLRLI